MNNDDDKFDKLYNYLIEQVYNGDEWKEDPEYDAERVEAIFKRIQPSLMGKLKAFKLEQCASDFIEYARHRIQMTYETIDEYKETGDISDSFGYKDVDAGQSWKNADELEPLTAEEIYDAEHIADELHDIECIAAIKDEDQQSRVIMWMADFFTSTIELIIAEEF
jgi:hypothetical protein